MSSDYNPYDNTEKSYKPLALKGICKQHHMLYYHKAWLENSEEGIFKNRILHMIFDNGL